MGLYVVWKAFQQMDRQDLRACSGVKHHPSFLLLHDFAKGWSFWNIWQDTFNLIPTKQGFLFPNTYGTYSLHGSGKRVVSINFTFSEFLVCFVQLCRGAKNTSCEGTVVLSIYQHHAALTVSPSITYSISPSSCLLICSESERNSAARQSGPTFLRISEHCKRNSIACFQMGSSSVALCTVLPRIEHLNLEPPLSLFPSHRTKQHHSSQFVV